MGIDQLIDEIDAHVFTGDYLATEKNRENLKEIIFRWLREIESWEEIAQEKEEKP